MAAVKQHIEALQDEVLAIYTKHMMAMRKLAAEYSIKRAEEMRNLKEQIGLDGVEFAELQAEAGSRQALFIAASKRFDILHNRKKSDESTNS